MKIFDRILHKLRQGAIENDSINLVMMLVLLGVVGWVGLMIMDKVQTVASLDSGSIFYNSSASLNDALQIGFDLLPVMIIVAVAGIILYYVLNMMGPRQGQ